MFRRAAVVVPLIAVFAVGCSSSQPSARKSPTPSTSTTSTNVAVAARVTNPKDAAVDLGRRMLDEAVLPSGARVSNVPAPDVLRGPSSVPAMGNLVFAHRIWTVDRAPHDVYEWLGAHVPHGFVKLGTSSGTNRGVPSWGVEDQLSPFPANTSYAELEFGVAAGASGQAVVRADSVVGWTAPRPPDELVPARDRVVTVSVIHVYEPGRPVGKSVVATAPQLVDPIINAFNALSVSPPDVVHGCPPMGRGSVSYRVAFASAPNARPDVVALIGGCGGVAVTVSGRTAPALGELGSVAFDDAVAHVLGLPFPHFG